MTERPVWQCYEWFIRLSETVKLVVYKSMGGWTVAINDAEDDALDFPTEEPAYPTVEKAKAAAEAWLAERNGQS